VARVAILVRLAYVAKAHQASQASPVERASMGGQAATAHLASQAGEGKMGGGEHVGRMVREASLEFQVNPAFPANLEFRGSLECLVGLGGRAVEE
jgi:hypothetical protein